MDVTTAAFRIKTGISLILWAITVSTISFYKPTFVVNESIINTVLLMGSGLLGIGIFKRKENDTL